MTGTPGWQWIRQQAEAPAYLRRTVWAALAGLGGFSLLRYGFERPVMALFALFGALPLTLFSQIPGRGWHRSRTLLAALPVGLVLVTAGTLLAAQDWSAAIGLFVVAFTASYLGVGGPSVGGLAISFQLYYLLPCFPPYEPDALGQRLGGLAIGILLAVATDRLLPPGPLPATYRSLLSTAVTAAADYTASVAAHLDGTHGAKSLVESKAAADRALLATRLSRVAAPERPTSAAVRDRALFDTRAALRNVTSQLDRLAALPQGSDDSAKAVLDSAAAALHRAADILTNSTPRPPEPELGTVLAGFWGIRARRLPTAAAGQVRQDAIVHATASSVLLLTEGARLASGAPLQDRWRQPDTPFRYAIVGGPTRWWRRLRLHLTPRSVLLQNALRGAIALAGARLIVGALDVPHGFWVLLTTLSLMRTSASDTRGALLPAFVGTAVGAAIATALVMMIKDVPAFYIAVTPVVFLVGFSLGPLLGPAWTQAALTLTLVCIFAQVMPTDSRLPAVRLMDVVIGGSIGAAASMLAWPRGAQSELRRAVADFLARSADACVAVTQRLDPRAADAPDPLRPALGAMFLAQAAYAQLRTEQASRLTSVQPWELAMAPGYTTVNGGELLLARHSSSPPSLGAETTNRLTNLARRVATDCTRVAEAIREAKPSVPRGHHPYPEAESAALGVAVQRGAADVLVIADFEAWLTGIAHEVSRVEQDFTTPDQAS